METLSVVNGQLVRSETLATKIVDDSFFRWTCGFEGVTTFKTGTTYYVARWSITGLAGLSAAEQDEAAHGRERDYMVVNPAKNGTDADAIHANLLKLIVQCAKEHEATMAPRAGKRARKAA